MTHMNAPLIPQLLYETDTNLFMNFRPENQTTTHNWFMSDATYITNLLFLVTDPTTIHFLTHNHTGQDSMVILTASLPNNHLTV